MNETHEKLYPSLPDLPTVTEEEIQDKVSAAASAAKQQERIRYIKDKQQQLNSKLEHYRKIKHRWTIIKYIAEGIGISATVICGILTIVVSSGVLSVPILALTTSSGGLLSPILAAITNKTFIEKHRKSIRCKHQKTKEVLDKLYLAFEKSSKDNIISIEEMEEFDKILKELNTTKASAASAAATTVKTTLTNEDFLSQLTQLLRTLPNQEYK